jgi:hypothetical protein
MATENAPGTAETQAAVSRETQEPPNENRRGLDWEKVEREDEGFKTSGGDVPVRFFPELLRGYFESLIGPDPVFPLLLRSNRCPRFLRGSFDDCPIRENLK